MATTITINDFKEQVLEANGPIVVDFWAPWCPPCRTIAPVLEELADEFSGRLAIGKLNTEEHESWRQHFGVMGLPTMIVFKDGVEVSRIVGARPKRSLRDAFEAAI
jgi:thioredoxin 1